MLQPHRLSHWFLKRVERLTGALPADVLRAPVNSEGEQLDGFLQALRGFKRLGTLGKPTIPDLRQSFGLAMAIMRRPYPVGRVQNLSLTGTDLQGRLYEPTERACGANGQPIPVLCVYFHGGGYAMGTLDDFDDACRLLCENSGLPWLAVDYPLAPEHPFPAAPDAALAAVHWAHKQRQLFGCEHIAVAGDSAGATLATGVAHTCTDTSFPLLAQLLIYPPTDLLTERGSRLQFNRGFFLDQRERELCYAAYLRDFEIESRDYRVSPLRGTPSARLCPAIVATAGFDMLRDEGQAYHEFLLKHAYASELLHFSTLGHGFINLAGVSRSAEAAVIKIAKQWRRLVAARAAAVR